MRGIANKDATSKWCPFARGVWLGDKDSNDLLATHNRVGNHDDGLDATLEYCHCVNTDCMAWRWCDGMDDDADLSDDRKGYCGLAGKP